MTISIWYYYFYFEYIFRIFFLILYNIRWKLEYSSLLLQCIPYIPQQTWMVEITLNQHWYVDISLGYTVNVASSLIQRWHINGWLTTLFHRWFNVDTSTVGWQHCFNSESTVKNKKCWLVSVNLYLPLWLQHLFKQIKGISWAKICNETGWTLFLAFWLKTNIYIPHYRQMSK